MNARIPLVTASIVLIISACSESTNTTAQAGAPGSTAQPPTTTRPETTTTEEPGPAHTRIEDLVYLSDDERQLRLDVYVPTGEGRFPVAVLFHGVPSSNGDAYQSMTAAAAADAVMLTFVPNWNPRRSGAPGPADLATRSPRRHVRLPMQSRKRRPMGATRRESSPPASRPEPSTRANSLPSGCGAPGWMRPPTCIPVATPCSTRPATWSPTCSTRPEPIEMTCEEGAPPGSKRSPPSTS